MTEPTTDFRVPVRQLLKLTIPAALVGILCGLLLIGLSALAKVVEDWLWDDLSGLFGLDRDSPVWIVVILTLTGLLVGLVIQFAPGHAGPDPASAGLVEPPLPPRVLPGLALAMVLMLAGGVSLGPENPIMAINAALVVWIGARVAGRVGVPQWMALSTAGTLGAMFGTPLAAALMFSEMDPGDRRIPLWDRLFAPLVSSSTGALTMLLLSDLDMAMDVPEYPGLHVTDLAIAVAVSLGAAALGLLASYVFTPLHRLVHRVRQPVLLLTLGGLVLGLLGAVGGSITLFKGLDQMKQLPGMVGETTALGFLAFALIKLVALLVASSVGFRGGRIFPATFVGVSLGFAVSVAFPSVPPALAVGAATVGIIVAATRSGWLSIFLVVAIIPQATLIPPLLFATLAAWLLVTNRPELRAAPLDEPTPAEAGSGAPLTPPDTTEEQGSVDRT
ncbi:putative ion-transport protein [Cellulomonas algicola]|uniref:Putative ion-transport protein n=1 Tax=Cellulomonas algicola TaxID=2071633 RepID=A0A401V0K1_9CELL|nr:ion channel protein [Cellulomonas algicola]GCD20477.1 putative ion-transport protein [Cellulomonas algicola]